MAKEEIQEEAKKLGLEITKEGGKEKTIAELEADIEANKTIEDVDMGPTANTPPVPKELKEEETPEPETKEIEVEVVEVEGENEPEIDWNLERFKDPEAIYAITHYSRGRDGGEKKLRDFLNSCLPKK